MSTTLNQRGIELFAGLFLFAVFLAVHDFSSITSSAQNIAQLLLKTIDGVGPKNVVQVIIDNATNGKATRKIIEQKYPHIFWYGCLVHTLNPFDA